MDPSNYKIHKKPPIHYGPKKAPLKLQRLDPKPPAISASPARSKAQPNKTPIVAPKTIPTQPITPKVKTQLQTPRKAPADEKSTTVQSSNANKPFSLELEAIELPKKLKNSKTKKAVKPMLYTLLVVVVLGMLAAGGYLYYNKVYAFNKHKSSSSADVKISSNSNNPINNSKVSENPILNADFIVYGLKEGSLFVTNKTNYQQDENVPTIKVIAKSTYPNDKREITINQQKVESNFAEDPDGLKKMADSIGANMPLTTDKGTSYIITGNATGLISIGATLISVRSSASLAIVEWQQIFNNLEPVQI